MGQDNTNNPPCVNPAGDSDALTRKPLNAAILVGGGSTRMGVDKAGMSLDDSTMARRAAERIRPAVQQIALVGRCPNIADIPAVVRLEDFPAARGPMAGILAALEHDSACDWLVLACDMPLADVEAIHWLAGCRTSDAAATLGRLPDCEYPEPLLAIYSRLALPVLRAAVARRDHAMHRAIKQMPARIHAIPESLARQWLNINTPQQWQEFLRQQ